MERLSTKKEVAAALNVNTRTINRYVLQNMPHDKLRNGQLRFNIDECKKWAKGD